MVPGPGGAVRQHDIVWHYVMLCRSLIYDCITLCCIIVYYVTLYYIVLCYGVLCSVIFIWSPGPQGAVRRRREL